MSLNRYADLVEKKIVKSRMTLKRMVDFHGFPPGRLISPNIRVWTDEEIAEYVESRPTERKRDFATGQHARAPVTGGAV